jgi:hypothetical protein
MVTMPPYHCRRAWLRSFWLIASGVVGIVCGFILAAAGGAHAPGAGALVAAAMAVPGLIWPQAASVPFRAWNRLAGAFAAAARLYVTRVCLYTIFPAVGLLGSSMKMDSRDVVESGWTRRRHAGTIAFRSPADLDSQAAQERNWFRTYLSWAARSENRWSFGLVPFLMLLALVEEDVATSRPEHDIYTLY